MADDNHWYTLWQALCSALLVAEVVAVQSDQGAWYTAADNVLTVIEQQSP